MQIQWVNQKKNKYEKRKKKNQIKNNRNDQKGNANNKQKGKTEDSQDNQNRGFPNNLGENKFGWSYRELKKSFPDLNNMINEHSKSNMNYQKALALTRTWIANNVDKNNINNDVVIDFIKNEL